MIRAKPVPLPLHLLEHLASYVEQVLNLLQVMQEALIAWHVEHQV